MKRLFIGGLVAVVLTVTACADKKSPPSADAPSAPSTSGAPKIALASNASGLKIGLVVSSSGPGADVKDLAAGAYVAAFRLNGATDSREKATLLVADDNGTPDGAQSAIASLVDQGVAGVVYASIGDHVLNGVVKAAELGTPVVLPYADDPRVLTQGSSAFMTGPTVPQVAEEFASHLRDANRSKVALVRQAGAYGDAGRVALADAGVTFLSDTPFAPGGAFDGKGVVAGKPDAVVVWAEATAAAAVADGLAAAGFGGEVLFANRAAVPSFGKLVVGALAPPVGDGALSAGTWPGPDTPGNAVDAFFLARDKAVSDGGVTADLALADFRSHDAVLALVAAAGDKSDRASTLAALRESRSQAAGSAGPPLDFSSTHALSADNVALLTYSTLDDGSGRYPSVATAGGHWVAVAGTFETPEAMKGLDNPYGG